MLQVTTQLLNICPEEDQVRAVSRDPDVIKDIVAPSIRVQLAAVRAFPECIEYVHCPCEVVQLEAVRRDPTVVKYIEQASAFTQMTAIVESAKIGSPKLEFQGNVFKSTKEALKALEAWNKFQFMSKSDVYSFEKYTYF